MQVMTVIIALIPILVIAPVVFLFARFLKGKAWWKKDGNGAFAKGQVAKAAIFWGLLTGFYLVVLEILLPGDADYALRGQIPRASNMEEISTDTDELYIRPTNTTFRWVYAPLRKPQKDWALKFNYVLSKYDKVPTIGPGPGGDLVEIFTEKKVPKIQGALRVRYSKEMDEANEVQIELERDPVTQEPKVDESGNIMCKLFCDNVPMEKAANLTESLLPGFLQPAYAQSHDPFLATAVPFQQLWKQRLDESDLTLRQLNRRELILRANRGIPYEEPLTEATGESKDVIALINGILSGEWQVSYVMQMDALHIIDGFKPSLKEYFRLNRMLSTRAIYTIMSLMLSSEPEAQGLAFQVIADCVHDDEGMPILEKYIQFLEPRLEPDAGFDKAFEETRINYLRLARASGFMIWAAQYVDRQGNREQAMGLLEDAVREAFDLIPWAKERLVARSYVASPLYERAKMIARHAESPEDIDIARDRFREFTDFVEENGLTPDYSAALTRARAYREKPETSSLETYTPAEYKIGIYVWQGSDEHPLVDAMMKVLRNEGFRLVNRSLYQVKGNTLITRAGNKITPVPYNLQIRYSRPALEYDMARRIQVVLGSEDMEFANIELFPTRTMESPGFISIFFPYQSSSSSSTW